MIIDFVGKRFVYLAISAILTIPGLISLAIPPSLRPGIEFTSGALMSVRFNDAPEQGTLREEMGRLGYHDAIIQRTSDGDYLIRTRMLTTEQRDPNGQIVVQGERKQLLDGLQEKFGTATVLSFDEVSPIVAQEIGQRSALAVVVASVFILLYITFAFRQVPNPFRFGVCAIIALLHDVVIVMGAFSIMGKLFGTEVDSLFITAVLTVIGFSVHDTIVVFDRIRENVARHQELPLAAQVNRSVLETMGRSLNTSLTTIFVLLAMLLIGGPSIRGFLLALTIGIVIGTYSSIFNASALLVSWDKGEIGRFFRLSRRAPKAVATTLLHLVGV